MAYLDPRILEFRRLHESGCFLIPNPWDVGSARILEGLGVKALATSSAGLAWTLGRRDNGATLEEALAHLTAVCAAVRVPVNADFERGYATEPDEVAVNVAKACETGLAGLSIEDSSHDPEHPLFDFELSVARVRAARRAIDASGTGILLTGRSEGFRFGQTDLGETIRRLTAYAEAGAECLFAPGLPSAAHVEAVVKAVAPTPVNALVGSNNFTVPQLAKLGARRFSVGGGLYRTALTAFLTSAREIVEQGTFEGLGRALPFAEVDRLFGE